MTVLKPNGAITWRIRSATGTSVFALKVKRGFTLASYAACSSVLAVHANTAPFCLVNVRRTPEMMYTP